MATPRSPSAADLVVGCAFTVALQAEIWFPQWLAADTDLTGRPTLSLISLAITLPMVLRRCLPWVAGLTSLAATALISQQATPPEGLADLAALLVVSYSLGRYAERPLGYLGVVPVLLAAAGIGQDGADAAFVSILLGAAWGAGILVGRGRDHAEALDIARLDSEQRTLTVEREATHAERRRIAAELHDVVAHRLTMIVVQAQAADAALDSEPRAARDTLTAVEESARAALAELRQVVGVLNQAESPPPENLDLGGLPGLIEQARRAGVAASYEVTGAPQPVTPAVALAASRIVQEALSNVARHAPGAVTRVGLHHEDTVLRLSVDNDGDPVSVPTPGHGLTGMTTRASFVGGTLTAEPRDAGGFSVRAVLPIAQEMR